MKLKFICILLFSMIEASAQEIRFMDHEYFTCSAFGSPTTSINKTDFNFGIDIELVSYAKYVRLGINRIENIESNYTYLIGSFGLNLTSGYFDKLRYYLGLRSGLINRNKGMYPTTGIECGIDFDLTEDLYVGFKATYDYRSDKVAISLPKKWEESTCFRIGYAFN
jgi:hypothetical protein